MSVTTYFHAVNAGDIICHDGRAKKPTLIKIW